MNSISKEQKQKISEAYDSEPWWYDIRGFFILTFSYRVSLLNQIHFFAQNISDDHLEVAVGSGSLFTIILNYMKLKGHRPKHIVAFDYAESMLAGAIRKLRKYPEIELFVADASHLPFPDERFTSISIANAIHCFADLDRSLREMRRVLKPTGHMACNVLLYPTGPYLLRWLANRINQWGMKKGILVTPYTKDDFLNRLKQTGFIIETVKASGNSMNVVARRD